MNKIPLMILCAGLLLVVGCASPASTPTPVSEVTVPTPTATSFPQPEPTATSVPQPELSPTELPKLIWLDLPYVPEGGARQTLDVYLPGIGDGPFPTILAIHGGGFRTRSKSLYYLLAGYLNELGYALVSTNYRLTASSSYPAQVEDVFCALAWIHANHATYGFDNEHIFIMGDSAGGYLAAMLGTVDRPSAYLENCPHTLPASDWIQGVVVFYGFYDLTSIDGYTYGDIKLGLEPYLGAEFSEIPPETLAEMSPMSWVDGSEPPFLLIHGASDTQIPSWMSEDFAAVLEEVGVEVELVLVEAGHGFTVQSLSTPANRRSLEAIEAFLSALSEQ